MNHPSPEIAAALRPSWPGLAGYLALLACGVGLFFVVRTLGEGLSAPAAPTEVRPVGRPMAEQVDVVMHVTATLAAVIGLGFVLSRLLRPLGSLTSCWLSWRKN